MNPLSPDLDPMLWAKKPRSALAMSVVFEEARKGRDTRFAEIVAKLVTDGHATEGGNAIHVWTGNDWARA